MAHTKEFLAMILGSRDENGAIVPANLDGVGNTAREVAERKTFEAKRKAEAEAKARGVK